MEKENCIQKKKQNLIVEIHLFINLRTIIRKKQEQTMSKKDSFLRPLLPSQKTKTCNSFLISFLVFDIVLFLFFASFSFAYKIRIERPVLRFKKDGSFTIMQVRISLKSSSRLLTHILTTIFEIPFSPNSASEVLSVWKTQIL